MGAENDMSLAARMATPAKDARAAEVRAGGASERELKFMVDADTVPALLAHPLAQGETLARRLRSTYFDTNRREVETAGFGLRVRRDGRIWLQTVKRDLAGRWPARSEWEWPIRNGSVDLKGLAKTPLAKRLKGKVQSLAPIFTIDVQRQTRRCRFMDSEIDVAIDIGEIDASGRKEPICEVELELKTGETTSLFLFAQQLAADVALRLSMASKAERGYRLAAGDASTPRRADAIAVDGRMSVGDAFRRACTEGLKQIAANSALVLRSPDPEAIHQLRVGIRRLRTALRTFAPALDDMRRAGAGAGLAWLSEELNQARDIDVFLAEAVPVGEESLARLRSALGQTRAAALEHARATIRSPRYGQVMLAVAMTLGGGDGVGTKSQRALGAKPIKKFATRALAEMLAAVRKRARSLQGADVEARHQLRIRTKRLRYAAEFFSPLFAARSKTTKAYLNASAAAQESLGAVNDIATAHGLADGLASTYSAEAAFAFGRAVGRLEADEHARLAGAADAVKALIGAKPFWRS